MAFISVTNEMNPFSFFFPSSSIFCKPIIYGLARKIFLAVFNTSIVVELEEGEILPSGGKKGNILLYNFVKLFAFLYIYREN